MQTSKLKNRNSIVIFEVWFLHSSEAWAGIEPAHVGFADRSVTTSPPGHYFGAA